MNALASVYGFVFIGAFVLYAGFYLVPLLRGLWRMKLGGLDGLVQAVRLDLDTVTAAERPGRAAPPDVAGHPDRPASPPPVRASRTAPGGAPLTPDEAQAVADAYADGYPDREIRESYDLTIDEWIDFRRVHDLKRGARREIGALGAAGPADVGKSWGAFLSELTAIQGVGPASADKLFQAFGGLAAVRTAGVEELAEIVPIQTARLVRDHFHPPEEEEEQEEAAVSPQRWAAERLSRLGSLKAGYQGVVQEAVDQVQSQYPDGAYQRFEIERLPTVAAFSERVGAARTMAGLFVLLGLLFTMIRLNGVVGGIAEAAGGTAMDPAAFLTTMGGLMDGIGGAFDSSIYGLGLLVVSLVVVGAVDWVAQRRVLRLESTVTHQVVPPLAAIHDRLQPNLTLADLLAETGTHLDRLGSTVGGLTGELDGSLSLLGDRIGNMMNDFRSFQEQYDKLDGLLGSMNTTSRAMTDAAALLKNTAKHTNDPLTRFNKTLLAHVETVADWASVGREGFDRLGREMEAAREHSDRMVEALARAAEDGFGESLREHQASIRAIETQAAGVERRLAALAASLDQAGAAGDGAAGAPLADDVA